VRKEEGAAMVTAANARPLQTDVYDKVAQDADELIARIISVNNGGRTPAGCAGRRQRGAAAAKPANT
jgi:membrane fusion protein (multidrug efflux system)